MRDEGQPVNHAGESQHSDWQSSDDERTSTRMVRDETRIAIAISV